jgi:conjugative transposon TraK protein
MDLKSLKDIPANFLLAKRAIAICLLVSLVTCIAMTSWAFYVTKNFAQTAYVLTSNGQLALAKGITAVEFTAFREPEIKNHINIFHRLFWNLDQFNIKQNMDKALYLIGNSGKQLYLSMTASGHYSSIENQNLLQTLAIDSIALELNMNPYKAAVYGKLKIERTDQQNQKTELFRAYFNLLNVARTDENPHGLLIENYDVETFPME